LKSLMRDNIIKELTSGTKLHDQEELTLCLDDLIFMVGILVHLTS
jgi:hypothetical protein